MKTLFTRIINQLNLLFFPVKCVSCGKYGLWLCYDCFSKINVIKSSFCPLCGIVTKQNKYCPNCRKKYNIYLDSLVVATDYQIAQNRMLVWNVKFLGNTQLIPILGDIMLSQGQKISRLAVIAYAPISARKLKIRGFNQAEMLARYIGNKLNLDVLQLLDFSGQVKDQIGLSRSERLANLSGKVRINSSVEVKDKCVVVIDDVVTTGATLNECAKVLKQNGAKKVIGWAFARNLSSDKY